VKRAIPKSDVVFSRPTDLRRDLSRLEARLNLVVCDLAINEEDRDAVLMEFRRLVSIGGRVMYIDHHQLPLSTTALDFHGVTLIHDERVSASELTYKAFQDLAGSESVFLAVYGAVGDYADHSPLIADELNRWDKRVLYLESGLLVEALTRRRDYDFQRMVVEQLAEGRSPSEVEEVVNEALKTLKDEYRVYEYVKKFSERRGNLAVVTQLPVKGFGGKAAIYASAITGAKVGVGVTLRNGRADLSLRTRDPLINLNELCRKLAMKLGGHGGGHPKAVGVEVPTERVQEFLDILDASLRTH